MSNTTTGPAPSWGRDQGLVEIGLPPRAGGDPDSDRALIVEAIHRYGWAYDERDATALEACFTEDFVFEGSIGGTEPVGPIDGRDAVLAWLADFWATQTDQRRHIVANSIVNDLGPDTATSLAYLLLTGAEDGEMQPITTGFYRIDFVKQDESWRMRRMFAGFDTHF